MQWAGVSRTSIARQIMCLSVFYREMRGLCITNYIDPMLWLTLTFKLLSKNYWTRLPQPCVRQWLMSKAFPIYLLHERNLLTAYCLCFVYDVINNKYLDRIQANHFCAFFIYSVFHRMYNTANSNAQRYAYLISQWKKRKIIGKKWPYCLVFLLFKSVRPPRQNKSWFIYFYLSCCLFLDKIILLRAQFH